MIFCTFTFVMALGNEKAHSFSFYQPQITSIWSLNYIHQQSTFKNDAQISVATKNMIYVTDSFFTVPNIPITNKESGIMTRALPTPTEKGILFFHQSETYELICNYASCWWITHPHQRTVVRNNWPVAMYISDAFTDNICKECGNNTYINLISCFGILCRQIFMDSCL